MNSFSTMTALWSFAACALIALIMRRRRRRMRDF